MNPDERNPDFIAFHYLDGYAPSFLFYTDQNKMVTEIRGCRATQGFKDKWIGKHISQVQDDIAQHLEGTFIHPGFWQDDPVIQNMLQQKLRSGNNFWSTKYQLDYFNEISDIYCTPEQRQQAEMNLAIKLEASMLEHNSISFNLNKKRSESFGRIELELEPESNYFKLVTDSYKTSFKS